MRRLFFVTLTTAALLSSAVAARAQASRRPPAPRVPRIVAANVLEAMYFKERAESDITPARLAAYGNALVARRGLDHAFDACAVVRANRNPPRAPHVSESARVFTYTLRRVGGAGVRFQLVTDVIPEDLTAGGTCGECFFAVPALRVSETEMLVVAAGGRRFRLARPPGFLLDEVSLVDETLRRSRRTWQLPYQATPLGLSPDRARLYLPLPNFEGEAWDEKLAVEISDAGVRFVPRAGLNLPEGEPVADSPAGPQDAHQSFMRFGTGGQSYVLRSSGPCT